MYIFITLSILLFSCQFSQALAQQDSKQIITLKDGSQIKGELAGINNGVYTVKTPIIGDVHVAANDVASITNANNPVNTLTTNPSNLSFNANQSIQAPGSSSSAMDQQIIATQQKMMSNPKSMATIQEMMQDPQILEALQDPALVQAVTSHDYSAVQNNPKIQEMIKNPKMQNFIKKLAATQQ